MQKERMRIVIVGHIDHGKSTLIGRLFYDTGSLPPEKVEEIREISEKLGRPMEFAFMMDHLREERTRGITIDTAQTFFRSDRREYIIIDAPGHKEFIKNMMTGASQAEASILIIDAEEGVRDQSRRHAYILGMMDLKSNIVVINKLDKVGFDEARFIEVRDEILAFLDKRGIQPQFVVPVSALEGDNVVKRSERTPWYEGPTILEALDTVAKQPVIEGRPFRFPVQDVYERDGKRIVVGRVESGVVQAGDTVLVAPEDREIRIATVEEFQKERDQAVAGESLGFTVEGDPPGRSRVLADRNQPPRVSARIEGSLFWMAPKPFVKGETLTFRCTTQEVGARIAEIRQRLNSSTLEVIEADADRIEDAEAGEVLIETETPVVVEAFTDIPELGRFVLERDDIIVAGGIITGTEA
jgi:sulfate adenylyltransferase subunit 1 (EFTu-like GTPase family)